MIFYDYVCKELQYIYSSRKKYALAISEWIARAV